ncbi:hypothetical protein BKA81DRAFT_410971 [Phyllosticta paracitricarpa]
MNTTMQNPSTPPPPLSEQNNNLVLSLKTQRLVSQAHNLVTITDARRSSGRQYKGLDPHGHTAGIVDMLALLDPRGAYRRPANMATPEARVLRNHTQRARKIHCELQKVVDQFCRDGLLRTPGSNSDNHDNTEDESADNDNRFDLNEDEQASGDEHQQVSNSKSLALCCLTILSPFLILYLLTMFWPFPSSASYPNTRHKQHPQQQGWFCPPPEPQDMPWLQSFTADTHLCNGIQEDSLRFPRSVEYIKRTMKIPGLFLVFMAFHSPLLIHM